MKKLKPLFGFECETNERGLVTIDVNCEFPQQKDNCLMLYNRLEELKIIDSKIEFPLRLNYWVVTINPTDKFTIMNYFKINGIKKIVEENKSKLTGKTTFIKPEVQYNKKAKYPNLHIHFYQLSEDEGMEILDIQDMIESCSIHYENTKQFTTKRLSDLEKYVNPLELQVMTFFPMELVEFDIENGDEILDFPQQMRMLNSVELPF
jgi:uncharacterized protein YfbU (UPF0304 family)